MKLAARIATAFALAALATPALACCEKAKTAGSSEQKPAVAKAEKKGAAQGEAKAKN
jgi:hypothetical protein